MGNVTESIWSNDQFTIPMAEVSHIIKHDRGITIVFKHSRWNEETQNFEPSVYLNKAAQSFKSDWCMYRHELERDYLNLTFNEG